MDRILNICFCLILIGIYCFAIADSSQCNVAVYHDKCEVCAHDKNCPRCQNVPNVECGHENTCRCKEGYARKLTGTDGRCVIPTQIVKFGGRCNTNDILCSDDDDIFCDSKVSTCACEIGYQRDNDLKLCISENPLIFDECNPSALPDLCTKNQKALKCDQLTHKCLVQKGWRYNCTTFQYEAVKEHGETCDEASCRTVKTCDPCNPDNHLECKNGFCVCLDGYVLDDTINGCVKIPGHDEDCSKSMCDPIDPNMVCNPETTKCECKGGYKYDKAKKKCTKKGPLTLVLWVLIGLSILFLLLLLLFLVYWFWYRKRKNRWGKGVPGASGEGLGRVSGNGGLKGEKKRRWWQGKEQKPKPTTKIPQNYDMPDTDAEFSNVSNLWRKGPPPSNKNKKKEILNLKRDSRKSKIQANKESKAKRPSTR